MSVEENGGNLEGRVSALEEAHKLLEDAMLVHAHLEAKAAQRIKEHAEFIARHEMLMSEFDDKLNALIDIVMKRNGGPEVQGSH